MTDAKVGGEESGDGEQGKRQGTWGREEGKSKKLMEMMFKVGRSKT